MKRLLATSMVGLALLGGAWVYGQGSGNTGSGGTGGAAGNAQPGVLGPCPAPSPGATASPTSTAVTPEASPSASAPAQCITVSIPQGAVGQGGQAFGISPLVIPPNTAVTWVNNDRIPHTVTSVDGLFDSGAIAPGQSFSFTFTNEGTYNYFCSIHGFASMNGTIQVQTAAGGTASPSPSATSPVAGGAVGGGTTASPTASPSESATPLASPSVNASPEVSATPVNTPLASPSATATPEASATPSATPSAAATTGANVGIGNNAGGGITNPQQQQSG